MDRLPLGRWSAHFAELESRKTSSTVGQDRPLPTRAVLCTEPAAVSSQLIGELGVSAAAVPGLASLIWSLRCVSSFCVATSMTPGTR